MIIINFKNIEIKILLNYFKKYLIEFFIKIFNYKLYFRLLLYIVE